MKILRTTAQDDLQEFIALTGKVLANWSKGDLAHAVNCLEEFACHVAEEYSLQPPDAFTGE